MKDYLTVNVRNLNFQQVITFFTVVECENFTKAAEQLNLSQAAVSRIIANLEMETHLILFVRKVRGAIPTPAGRILYKEWKEALRGIEKGYISAYRAQLGYIRDLNIGAIDMNQDMSYHIRMLDWFEKTFPDSVLKLEYETTEALREGLVSEKYDMIFVNYLEAEYLESVGIRCTRMVEKGCNLFIHKEHPLYHSKSISRENLQGEKIIFFGSSSISDSPYFQKFCKEYGVEQKNVRIEPDFKKIIISFARNKGLFFSEGIFEQGQLKEARCLPLAGCTSGLGVAWIEQGNRLPLKEIIQYVQMVARELY